MSASHDVRIRADFPGGNVILEHVEGDDVFVRQDLRDTEGSWFYWAFAVSGATGRALRFHFTDGDVIGVRGPAVSLDGGKSWAWTGTDCVDGSSFAYTFPPDVQEVRFSFGTPYQEADLREFLSRHADNPHLGVETLCRTAKGRDVECLRLGNLTGSPRLRALLTCRHHACEALASYALEGIMETVLGDCEVGQWLRENVEFLVVPFVDKDGVEEGDQGKNRKPRDHNRDYAGDPVHASTRAIRELVPAWSQGRLRFALDLHCPWIRGDYNEFIYFVGLEDPRNWPRLGEFSRLLETVRTGPLPFSAENDLPFGEAWNVRGNYDTGRGCSEWANDIPGIDLATSVEIPYANAGGVSVTADGARAFGRDLAHTSRHFLDQ